MPNRIKLITRLPKILIVNLIHYMKDRNTLLGETHMAAESGLTEEMANYLIHVPQGRSARLLRTSLGNGIEGLHTDGFSTCNLIVCIGQDKIALIHADLQAGSLPHQVINKIDWVGLPSQILLITRSTGEALKKLLLSNLPHTIKSHLMYKTMDDDHDGIVVSFNEDAPSDIHPKIKKYLISNRPPNLLHHPDEQRFTAVQKIEQLVGIREKQHTKKSRKKQQLIFDGTAWELVPERELNIDDSHSLTKEEMQNFNKNYSFILLANELIGLIALIQRNPNANVISYTKDLSFEVAFYLEGYLDNFNALPLLKKNLLEMTTSPHYKPKNEIDIAFKKQLIAIIKSADSSFDDIQNVITPYKTSQTTTFFRNNVLDEIETFSRHYRDRIYYEAARSITQSHKEKAKKLINAAISHMRDRNNKAAESLLKDALKEVTFSCPRNDQWLLTAYAQLGSCLHTLGEYQQALILLNFALELRQKYFGTVPGNFQKMETLRKGITACEKELASISEDLTSPAASEAHESATARASAL